MKYIGEFLDLNNNPYRITLVSNGDTSTTANVVLGDTPIITEWESEDSIFKPCKYSSATIKLVSKDYLFDLYSSKAQGTKVTLTDSANNIKWVGYLTPNLYNQGYEYDLEEIEIEAIDALSSLQYIDYSTTKKTVKSISGIISNILSKCNAYQYFYLPNTYQYSNLYTENFYSKTYISELNFFDEDGKAMKCDEVLEELCKYMGLTCVAEGEDVYFLDYDSVKLNYNHFYKIQVGEETSGIVVSLSDNKSITKDSYSENGSLISLGSTYNRITVKDSLYSTDSILPSLKDKDCMTNRNGVDKYEFCKIGWNGTDYRSYYKFYDHLYYKSYYYDAASMNLSTKKVYSYDDLTNLVGATITKNYNEKWEDTLPKKLDFKDYIFVHNLNKQDGLLRPVMDLVIDKPLILGGDNTYMVFTGNITFTGHNVFLPLDDYQEKGDKFKAEDLYVIGKLKYGNKYFNGATWVDTETTFKLYFDSEGNTNHLFNRNLKVKSNIDFTMNLKETEGYAVKLPKDTLFTELPTFTLYQPTSKITSNNMLKMGGYWLSDFDIKIEIGNLTDDQEFKSDTEYSNIINEDYVNDFDDVKFKVCTWDNKAANYSCVSYRNGGNSVFLDNIYNMCTGEYLRSEELYISRILRQYSEPPVILEVSFYNNVSPYTTFTSRQLGLSRTFIVDTLSIDWRTNTNKLKLVEKK